MSTAQLAPGPGVKSRLFVDVSCSGAHSIKVATRASTSATRKAGAASMNCARLAFRFTVRAWLHSTTPSVASPTKGTVQARPRAQAPAAYNGAGQRQTEAVERLRRQHQRRSRALLLVAGAGVVVQADDVAAPGHPCGALCHHASRPTGLASAQPGAVGISPGLMPASSSARVWRGLFGASTRRPSSTVTATDAPTSRPSRSSIPTQHSGPAVVQQQGFCAARTIARMA